MAEPRTMTAAERAHCVWIACPYCSSQPGHPCFPLVANSSPIQALPKPHMARVRAYRSERTGHG